MSHERSGLFGSAQNTPVNAIYNKIRSVVQNAENNFDDQIQLNFTVSTPSYFPIIPHDFPMETLADPIQQEYANSFKAINWQSNSQQTKDQILALVRLVEQHMYKDTLKPSNFGQADVQVGAPTCAML